MAVWAGQPQSVRFLRTSTVKFRRYAMATSFVRRHFHQHELPQNGDYTPKSITGKGRKTFRPIDAFGIVACANTDGIIGVNGKLPWDSLPSDREIFEHLTRDRILIVGRRTLLNERDGSLDHVRHAKHCIVVSGSIPCLKKDPRIIEKADMDMLRLARSLDEALDVARGLATDLENTNDNSLQPHKELKSDVTLHNNNENTDLNPFSTLHSSNGNLRCWVAGGERLYEEALQHPSALELHLSVVDVEIDIPSLALKHATRFPSRGRWEQSYKLFHKRAFPLPSEDKKLEPSFIYHIYKRNFSRPR